MRNAYVKVVQSYRMNEALNNEREWQAKRRKIRDVGKAEWQYLKAFGEGGEFTIVMSILHLIEKDQKFASLVVYSENGKKHYAIYNMGDDYSEYISLPGKEIENGTEDKFFQIPIVEFVKQYGPCTVFQHPSEIDDTYDMYGKYVSKFISRKR